MDTSLDANTARHHGMLLSRPVDNGGQLSCHLLMQQLVMSCILSMALILWKVYIYVKWSHIYSLVV